MIIKVVENLSESHIVQLHGLIYAVLALPKVPFTFPMTRAIPPRFLPYSSGGDGSGYYILAKHNSKL